MKRLLVLLALLLASLPAIADSTGQLLTADGTIYSVAVVPASERPDVVTDSFVLLVLTTRRGTEIATEVIPATLTRGGHYNPSLAYEPQSGTLFVFWMHRTGFLSSNLLVAARDSSGAWGDVITFGKPWDFRENLRIALTRKVDDPANGTSVPGVSVHLTWWELDSSSGREGARYTMVSIENGAVVSMEDLNLQSFVPADAPAADPALIDANLLKQPILFPTRDEVRVQFGSLATGRLHRVVVRPSLPLTPDGRIRIPVGRSDGDTSAPRMTITANSLVEGIADGQGGTALFTRDGGSLRYVLFRDGAWSDEQTISLDDQMHSAVAVEALRRLVREH